MNRNDELNTNPMNSIGNLVVNRRSMFKDLGAAALGVVAMMLTTNPLLTKLQQLTKLDREASRWQAPEAAKRPVRGGRRAAQ